MIKICDLIAVVHRQDFLAYYITLSEYVRNGSKVTTSFYLLLYLPVVSIQILSQ